MKFLFFILFILLFGCSSSKNKSDLFIDLQNEEIVTISLKHYNLDSIPKAINRLKKVKSLYILNDSSSGWTVYPPLSAFKNLKFAPPFKYLPEEITELENLRSLSLINLNLRRLPEDLVKFKKLDTLNLLFNKLTISEEIDKIKELKSLEYLNLLGNQFDSTDVLKIKAEIPGIYIVDDASK